MGRWHGGQAREQIRMRLRKKWELNKKDLHVQASATHRELSADVGPGSTESGGGGTRGKHRIRLRSTLQKQKYDTVHQFIKRCGAWAMGHGAPPVGTPILVLFICKLCMLRLGVIFRCGVEHCFWLFLEDTIGLAHDGIERDGTYRGIIPALSTHGPKGFTRSTLMVSSLEVL